MNFISGFLALCSAVGTGTATEVANAAGYARQPIGFNLPRSGVSLSAIPFDFGFVGVETDVVGRAIYDAPTGGNLLMVLPHAAPRPRAGQSTDRGEAGYITLVLSALGDYPDGAAFSGSFPAGASLGLCYDGAEVIGWTNTLPNPAAGITVFPRGGQFLSVRASALSAGVALTVSRGLLRS